MTIVYSVGAFDKSALAGLECRRQGRGAVTWLRLSSPSRHPPSVPPTRSNFICSCTVHTTMTKKVHVLELIDQLGDAGAEQLLYTFASEVDRSRFDLHFCALRPWAYPKVVPALRALGFSVIELDQHHAYDLHIFGKLIGYIRREHIDIIHTHLLASDIMGRVAGFVTRRPVVSTIHNERRDLEIEPRHQQWMERWSAHLWCRRIIVVSPGLRSEIADWFRLPLRRVTALSNGVNTARFRPSPGFEPLPLKRELVGGDYPLVTNVARLVPQKGQSCLVEAVARVIETHPEVRLVLVGDGPLRGELLSLAQERGIAGNFVITGLRIDVPAILAASDVFVLSSLWEGMPISLLEAMSAGCPAVATRVGGVGEVLEDGVTGLLVPPSDVAALAEAINRCLDDPASARQRAQRAARVVVQKYDVRTMARNWEALYLRELGRRS